MTDQNPPPAAPPANPHADVDALDALSAEAISSDPAAIAEAEAAAEEMPTGEVLAMVLGPAFDVLAPNWKISDSESRQLANAYGAVIDKYFPGALGNFGIELTAVVMTLAVIAPRMNKPRKLEPAKPEAAKPDAVAG